MFQVHIAKPQNQMAANIDGCTAFVNSNEYPTIQYSPLDSTGSQYLQPGAGKGQYLRMCTFVQYLKWALSHVQIFFSSVLVSYHAGYHGHNVTQTSVMFAMGTL